MPFILEDLTPEAVVKAMADNLSQYYRPYAELPGGEIHFETDCTWFVSGVPEKWFNGVIDTRFEEKNLESRVRTILEEFGRRSLPMFWNIFPGATPAALEIALLKQGLLPEAEEPGMALDLRRMNETVRAPDGLTIEPVTDRVALEDWTGVWMADIPESIAGHCRQVVYALGIEAGRPWRYYLARLGGKPVATLQLFYAAGVVSVQHVATLQAARKQGIATALTVHALKEAREAGYRVAALTSTPEGLPVYRRIGFQTLATFSAYGWRPR